jgi:hypothetical protein
MGMAPTLEGWLRMIQVVLRTHTRHAGQHVASLSMVLFTRGAALAKRKWLHLASDAGNNGDGGRRTGDQTSVPEYCL